MTLSNDIITIEVSEHGAEMVSIKKGGREYLWTGDAQFWNRHAPILFPVVGKPYNNELHVDGKSYPMKQHGFARDSEFECVNAVMGEQRSATLWSQCVSMRMIPPENQYPYRLGLEVQYGLEGRRVEVVWTVENLDDKEAYFQIGAHPGFLLPDYDAADEVHGYVRYRDREGRPVNPVAVSALKDGNRVPLDTPQTFKSEMPLTADTFAHDALMFEGGQVAEAVLCDKEGNPVLGVGCRQAEAYGIWAPHKEGCPFVCLEPWCGICDPYGFTGDISTRQYIHRLAPREEYQFAYTIEIYK